MHYPRDKRALNKMERSILTLRVRGLMFFAVEERLKCFH